MVYNKNGDGMKKIVYYFKRMRDMDYKRIIQTLKRLHKKTKKSYWFLIKDILSCSKYHGAGYVDYELFEMYNMNEDIRKTVMTRGRNNALIRRFNDPEGQALFLNKEKFNVLFHDLLKRDFFILEDDEKALNHFIKGKREIMAKPSSGSCGKGIEKIHIEDHSDLYSYLKEKDFRLLEEVVVQDRKMNELCSTGVNTIRTITLRMNGKTKVVAAYLRIGNGKIVDNFNSGGMVVPVDIKTGKIHDVAVDKKGNVYEKHPLTHTSIVGFQIPKWKEVLSLVKEASTRVPNVGMVGWDVAISNKGPLIIEGNEFPGYDIYQLPVHRKNGEGMYPVFQAAIEELKKQA